MNRKKKTKTVLASGLNRQTIAATLLEYFQRFGAVSKVLINVDDNDEPLGTATIVYKEIPYDTSELIGKHNIDGKSVRVEFTKNLSDTYYTGNAKYINSKINAKSLSMGTFVKPNHFVEEWETTQQVNYNLRYTQRKVDIFFNHLGDEYRIEYKFKYVDGGMKVERDELTTILTIPLRYPAIFWKRNFQSIKEAHNSITVSPAWERVIHIPLNKEANLSKPYGNLSPIRRPGIIDIGNWIVLRLVFVASIELDQKLKEASDYNLVPRDLSRMKPYITVTKSQDMPKCRDHIGREQLNLHYDVLYLLESCISYHLFNEYNLNEEFYTTFLKELNKDISCGFLQILSTSKLPTYDPKLAFNRIWKSMGIKVKEQRSIPSHCAMLRKVIVTPSHLYIQPPSLETTNRVVRYYKDQADRFIRVQFMDEGFNHVGASHTTLSKEVIYNRIFDTLKKGIQIGARRYEFLAFSGSQLREQGCWFFAPSPELTPDMIRSWMGVFSHEKVVAKHAVRMGQCFSSTRPVYTLQKHEVQYIEDIEHNGFVFSDGVGKMAPGLAEQVAFQMDLKMVPSAFQFRLGGAKGVLTVDNSLTGDIKVQLRPSQIKFTSSHLTLEAIRTSTYIHGYLNRQIITLLSCLGVKDEVFMEFMDDMLHEVNRILQKPEETVRVLMGNVDEHGTVASMIPIIQSGFLEKKDPYITNLLNLFRVNILKDLKKKAKITVPKGAYLLGVMDETNTLEEGEIFVQIYNTSNNGGHKEVITGEVVVFRNPCFHPGDVRVVKAVDRENLHHLVDVVVFSAKGFRDISSMCSGGDLDGDDYTVYWDPKLLPKIKNYPPMDYTASAAKVVEDVKIRDIVKFFVNYISYNNLGQIANAHLATADISPTGARDGKCILLAQLHSQAVDFPKSGKPANMSEELIVKTFPDFMQKKDKEAYESKKVLGRIFRAIDKSDYKEYQSTLVDETVYDPRLRMPGMELYVAEARNLRSRYNQDLSALMNQFGIQTEAEICSGYIIKWLKKGKSKTRYKQHDYTMKAMRDHKALWKKNFEQEFYDAKKNIDYSYRAKIDAKAAAWYYVTYHPHERKRDISVEGGFLSFVWSIYPYICEIAKRNTHKTSTDPKLFIPLEEQVIKEGAQKLRIDRGNVVTLDASEDEDDDNELLEYETDQSDDDDEVYDFKTIFQSNANSSHIFAADIDAAMNGRTNTNAIFNSLAQRPLESYQSVITADATLEDLSAALLGTKVKDAT